MEMKRTYETPEVSVVTFPMEEPICNVSDYSGFVKDEEEDWDD